MAPDMAGRGFGQHRRQKKKRLQWISGFPRSALPLATGSGSSQTVALLG